MNFINFLFHGSIIIYWLLLLFSNSIRKGAPGYLIIVNGGNSTREVDLSKSDSLWNNASEEELIKIPSEAKVAVLSADSKSTYTEG